MTRVQITGFTVSENGERAPFHLVIGEPQAYPEEDRRAGLWGASLECTLTPPDFDVVSEWPDHTVAVAIQIVLERLEDERMTLEDDEGMAITLPTPESIFPKFVD
ncbi:MULTISPECIES: hypothetical protein [Limibacillus]|jgi:hypothetical protein|uniref:Uncharacterized protein n=1 Tax=Limibacillus halophilus TaxID=1579333 RepID=A0A839SVH1_9PROT|nr:hypothetical protein [Limibacillus halophilus]MBB3066472.1 hypothetical protein [Limibacillus halophilus]